MALEIKIDKRKAKVDLIEKDGNRMKVKVDERIYEVDVAMVEDMVYSILHAGRSYNLEMIQGNTPNSYHVNSLYNSYHIDIQDASKLKLSKSKDHHGGEERLVTTPMPAKIVKVLVKAGDTVKNGQTVIIVSAMKMEMEFKAKMDGKVKKVFVKEDDTVNVNETLIELA
jgi:biotin carboxyl carrier protein